MNQSFLAPLIVRVWLDADEDEQQWYATCIAREAEFRAEHNWPDDGLHPVVVYALRWLRENEEPIR